MNNQITVTTVNQLLTPEIRASLEAKNENILDIINAAFKPFGVTFEQGVSLSQMVKKSTQYQALDGQKGKQSEFFNKIKSTAKACNLGEQVTLWAILNNYWARFNGTLTDKKTGELKQANISFMAPAVKASKLDDEMARDTRDARTALENKALIEKVRTLEAQVLSITAV